MASTPTSTSTSKLRFARYAEVALPVPLPRTFSYGVPEALARAEPGSRARVRFGPRNLIGCVTEVRDEAPELPSGTTLLPLGSILDDEPVLTPSQLALARWISDYYLAAPGLVCRAMMPPQTPRAERVLYRRTDVADASDESATKRERELLAALGAQARPMTATALAKSLGKKSVAGTLAALVAKSLVAREDEASARRGRGRTQQVARITEAGRVALLEEKLHPTTVRVLTLLSVATDVVPVATVRYEVGIEKGGPFRRLASKGYIELAREQVRATPWGRLRESPAIAAAGVTLTRAQEGALEAIVGATKQGAFSPMVLRGVTASGKTEVYLRAAEAVLAAGKTVLILVPEIALTPRLAALLYARFDERVAILHSALGSGEKRDEWWRVRQGRASVVVGARSAVLAPVENLGLVVVDEEHESSYKQEESPRYNARDVAIVRARDANAVVVLGSATPSLESYTHAVEGRYRLVELPERIGEKALAAVDFIDMKEVAREEGPDTIVSGQLLGAMRACVEGGDQAMVLLNRRGYAGQLLCRQCGLALTCTDCSVAMTLHRNATLAVCHLCGLGRAVPSSCEVCRGEYLRQTGYGTERVEEYLNGAFPERRVARMDRDTMRRKGSHESLLARFAAKEIDILVGTQMLAKGHDFPAVTLVGVLAADNGLGAPDFRAAERTFQLLTQVAGRAGRGERAGQVLIQTFAPDHYSLQFAQSQDFQGFYETERKFRAALLYPPVVSLVNLVFEGATMPEATGHARRAGSFLKREKKEGMRVLGPAFAVRSKVKGRYRCQILIKVARRRHAHLRSLIRGLLSDETMARVMMVDIDPMNLA